MEGSSERRAAVVTGAASWEAVIALLLTGPFLLARYGWELSARAGPGASWRSPRRTRSPPHRSSRPTWRPSTGFLGLVKTLAQAKARGIPEERVLEDVILEPHAVKRLLEPEEVAATVSFLVGRGGLGFTGVPVTMELGWTGR